MGKVVVILLFFATSLLATEPVFQYSNAFDKSLLEAAQRPGIPVSAIQNGRLASYTLRYASVDAVRQELLTLHPNLAISGDLRSRTLHVIASPSIQKIAQELIDRVDRPLRQVQLEVQVIEVGSLALSQHKSLFSQFESGIELTYDAATHTLRPAQDLMLTLSGLVQSGQAKLMAKPSVTVMEHEKACIKVGDQIPYSTVVVDNNFRSQQIHFLDTGIDMTLSPRVSSANHVEVKVELNVATIQLWKDVGQGQYPVISKRAVGTLVDITSGQTLVIGGLLNETSRQAGNRLPILSKIPLLGSLFKTTSDEKAQTDVVFLITPRVL